MAFYDITIERYQTFGTRIEADNQAEAERIGGELLLALYPETDDVTVQARAMAAECPGCRTTKEMDEHGGATVRDCLDHRSQCSATIQSIDCTHTCRGDNLCGKCWAARAMVGV